MTSEIWGYLFMQKALLAGLITAVTCPVLGIFIVVRRLSLIGDGLGHMAFAGVTGGYLLGWYPAFGALLFTVAGAFGIEHLRRKYGDRADMGLAIFFYAGMALAIIFSTITRMPSAGLLGFLFGSILTVSWLDVALIACSALCVLLFIYKNFEKLVLLSLNEDIAKVAGVDANYLNMALSVISAVAVVSGMMVVGALLVSALMIVPVACADQFKKGFKTTVFLAVIIAVCAVLSGLCFSFYADIAPGGSIIMSAISFYVLIGMAVGLYREFVKKMAQ